MDSMAQDVRQVAYGDYARWKGWDGARDLGAIAEIFEAELRRAGLRPPAKLLEIGFGNGDFLTWSRNSGYEICGVEINENFVSAARAHGFNVWLGSISTVDPGSDFDAIIFFDVLEHLTKVEIIEHLHMVRRLLKPCGLIVARFPNAASPFGLWAQTGDITHETALSESSIRQLGAMTGFEIVFAGNSARTYRGGRRKGIAIVKRSAYLIRSLCEIFFGYLYIGRRVPLDVCMTVVLRRV